MESWVRGFFQMMSKGSGRVLGLCQCRVLGILVLLLFPQAGLLAVEGAIGEEPIIKPEGKVVEFDESKIDVDDFEFGVYYGLLTIEDFESDVIMGGKLAYHVTERFFLEASYATSTAGETSYEKLSGAAKILTDEERDYVYYNLSVGYSLFPGEAYFSKSKTFDTALYIVGGLGITEFAGDEFFTMSYGIGYRVLLNDWFAVHVVFKDHMFDIDILGEDKTIVNAERTLGVSMFF